MLIQANPFFPGNKGIGRAHSSYANSLSQAAAPSVLQTPFPESSLFLPTPVAQGGQAGWADFLVDVRNATTLESDAHVKLGGIIQDDVVVPLRQIVSSKTSIRPSLS